MNLHILICMDIFISQISPYMRTQNLNLFTPPLYHSSAHIPLLKNKYSTTHPKIFRHQEHCPSINSFIPPQPVISPNFLHLLISSPWSNRPLERFPLHIPNPALSMISLLSSAILKLFPNFSPHSHAMGPQLSSEVPLIESSSDFGITEISVCSNQPPGFKWSRIEE